MIDSANAGFVHAPSVNHALTAAVLRNAYISRASSDSAEPYKVNLTSERVRLALEVVEGMQQGQSLGALLGYRLERDLHDTSSEELDTYIYELRKLFPLNSNRMQSTQIAEGRPADTPQEAERNQEEEDALSGDAAIAKIEARNVVDGLALLDHIRKVDRHEYPFGFEIGDGPAQLKSASLGQSGAINAAIKRLMNVRDAVADLAMAEGVHQVVQGNYERAAGALDAYSKGQYPQLPEVIRSPGSGTSITHRFGIHLDPDAAPLAQDSPRAKVEPAINAWVRDLLPADLDTIACIVEHKVPTYDETLPPPSAVGTKVTLKQLGLSPVDLLFVLTTGSDQGVTGPDDFVLRHLYASNPPSDADVVIRYTRTFDPAEGTLSLFELAPLIESLRTLILSSRGLLATDMAVPNEGSRGQNVTAAIDAGRILAARQDVLDALDDLEDDIVDPLKPLVDAEDFEVALGNRAALIAQGDTRLGKFVEHLDTLSRLGSDQAGFGFVYAQRRAIHVSARTKVADYRKRWRDRRDLHRDLIDGLPAAATNEEKLAILAKAEALVSSSLTIPPPAVAAYTAAVAAKRNAFELRLQDFDTLLATDFATFKSLFDAIAALGGNLADFDLTPLDVDDEERQTLILLEDLLAQAGALVSSARKAMDDVKALTDKAAASASPTERLSILGEAAKVIFGKDFLILPRFTLDEDQSAELAKCAAAKDSLLDHQMTELKADFPIDDWLYGVARVRDKLAAWENLAVLAEAFRERPSLELIPLQLPYAEDEPWLALAWPEGLEITTDKLLYTAYSPDFGPAKSQCGLLVDEWTEVVPSKRETTGLTFHFDRPNTEPPQAMLLVTPPAFTGEWQWGDVVAAMHETLDLAKIRAVEPDQVDATDYAQFLPATVAATSAWPVTMAVNFAMASDKAFQFSGGNDA